VDNALHLRSYILASLFASMTAAGAFIRIPLGPVPFTLQDFFVLLSGSLLGPRFGPLSQVIYLVIGLVGLPVFSLGGGPGYIFQPTFGYLLAFPITSHIIGRLLYSGPNPLPDKTKSFPRIAVAISAGAIMMFALGVTVLYLNLRYVAGQPIPLSAAIWSGFVVFVPGSILKIVLSSILTQKLSPHLRSV
jgi:biotin transport system substrate-specific component